VSTTARIIDGYLEGRHVRQNAWGCDGGGAVVDTGAGADG
jgi:hypothetical protein